MTGLERMTNESVVKRLTYRHTSRQIKLNLQAPSPHNHESRFNLFGLIKHQCITYMSVAKYKTEYYF